MNVVRGLDLLWHPVEPWVVSFCGEFRLIADYLRRFQASKSDVLVVTLEGSKMVTLDAMFDEFSVKLSFPDYFGHNMDALDECLSDLDWLDFAALVLLIRDADRVLECERSTLAELLVDTLSRIGAEWSHPVCLGEEWDRSAIPFHTVLAFEDASCGVFPGIPTITL